MQEASFGFGRELCNWKERKAELYLLFHPVTLFSNSIIAPELETVHALVTLVQESCFRLDRDIGADLRIEVLELSRVGGLYAD